MMGVAVEQMLDLWWTELRQVKAHLRALFPHPSVAASAAAFLDGDRPPLGGAGLMLVQRWPFHHGQPGRQSWSGERRRPGCEGGHEQLRSRRPVAQRSMRPHAVGVLSPALDHNFGLPQRVENLSIQQFVSQPTSVTPIERIASATLRPCETSTSTWRSLATISSGLCLFLTRDPSSFSSHEPYFKADHFKGAGSVIEIF